MKGKTKTIIWVSIILVFIILCAILIPVLWPMALTQTKSFADRFGSTAPLGQIIVIAQRNDNSKYQLLLTSLPSASSGGSALVWNQPYYIVFNPTKSTDPTQTVFDTLEEANAYSQETYVASPANKEFAPISTTATNADYKNITPYFF